MRFFAIVALLGSVAAIKLSPHAPTHLKHAPTHLKHAPTHLKHVSQKFIKSKWENLTDEQE